MDRAEREPYLTVAEQVGVCEGYSELIIFIPNGRTQEERPASFQFKQQAG